MKKRYLIAILEVPDGATVKETKEYVKSELKAAGGHRHPDDSLHAGVQTISVFTPKFSDFNRLVKSI